MTESSPGRVNDYFLSRYRDMSKSHKKHAGLPVPMLGGRPVRPTSLVCPIKRLITGMKRIPLLCDMRRPSNKH